MATHSSILTWRIPWTEEPGRLQSSESHGVKHDWSDLAHTHLMMLWGLSKIIDTTSLALPKVSHYYCLFYYFVSYLTEWNHYWWQSLCGKKLSRLSFQFLHMFGTGWVLPHHPSSLLPRSFKAGLVLRPIQEPPSQYLPANSIFHHGLLFLL